MELVAGVGLVQLARLFELVAHVGVLGVGQGGSGLDGVNAGLVKGHGVKAGKEADIPDDGLVVLVVAVAVGAHVNGQADVEARAAVHDGLGVLGDLVVKHLSGLVVVRADGVLVAHGDAAAAAHALAVVDAGHVDLANLAVGKLMLVGLVKREGAVRADLLALAAPDAPLLRDAGLAGGMLLHLACARAAAHAQVLHGAAKAGLLVALEVGEADDHVGIHEGAADLGVLDVLAALDGHLDLVQAPEAVGDDGVASGLEGVEAVGVGTVQVVQGVLATTYVERVAVGDERLAAQLAYHVHDGAGIVGPQVAEVARLSQVHLDGDELVLKVNLADAGCLDEPLELVGQAIAHVRVQVAEVDLRRLHALSSRWWCPLRRPLSRATATRLSHPGAAPSQAFGKSRSA